jgi:hypothetical protein
LIAILIEGLAGIEEKDLIAEVDWAAGDIKMIKLLKGEIYLGVKIEMYNFNAEHNQLLAYLSIFPKRTSTARAT